MQHPNLRGRAGRTIECFKCLGLSAVGCYHLPASSTLSALRASDSEIPTIFRNVSTRADSLKTCGKFAQMKGLSYFGLRGNQCYCSSNVDFVRGGPAESCGGEGCEDCIGVYQITEQENFELSVRAFESCGPGYCRQEVSNELVCSGGVRTIWLPPKADVLLHITLLLMWAITTSWS